MKRTIPLLITAVGGFILIVAYFIPISQGWGEVAAIWFDVLASIAFVLGGGNLLKLHLQKVSDRQSGWAYSLITVLAFLLTLGVGLFKVGSPPATLSEFYGETWVGLDFDELPANLVFKVEGQIPNRPDGENLPHSVVGQLFQEGNEIVFHGWMRKNQRDSLYEYKDELKWKCAVETLFESSQPSGVLAGKVAYYHDYRSLSFRGYMGEAERDALLAIGSEPVWTEAVNSLYEKSRYSSSNTFEGTPDWFDASGLPADVTFDADAATLSIQGPMSAGIRNAIAGEYPVSRPMSQEEKTALLDEIKALGPVHPKQEEEFFKVLAGLWTVDQLHRMIDEAGKPQRIDKTFCEMYAEQQQGVSDIDTTRSDDTTYTLNEAQLAILREFARDESMSVSTLKSRLGDAGNFKDNQGAVIDAFLASVPTTAERGRNLCFAMMRAFDDEGNQLDLNEAQRDFLLEKYRKQQQWRKNVGELFIAAHRVKYPWSGGYRDQGMPFWWLYEYAFKPLTATMFAMLAFYVASAAFRAFRAKNLEAILLLGTAFIILLGRTAAGPILTEWMPEAVAGLKIENLTVYIMQVFNTAGNRAIMIGIALGIASTSLKVLLGVDRSYLGSGED